MNLKMFFGLIAMMISATHAQAGDFGGSVSQEQTKIGAMQFLLSLEKNLKELQEKKSERLRELGMSEFDEKLLNGVDPGVLRVLDEKLLTIVGDINYCVAMKDLHEQLLHKILRKESKAKL